MSMNDFKQRPVGRWVAGLVLSLLVAILSVWSCRIEHRVSSSEARWRD